MFSPQRLQITDSLFVKDQEEGKEKSVEDESSIENFKNYKILVAAAQQGDSEAQFKLAERAYKLWQQEAKKNDLYESKEWLEKAASQGHELAQNRLGLLYYAGKGIEKDTQQALKWLQEAAKIRFAKAQRNLGLIYYHQKNYLNALAWYQKAADQGSANAQCKLGIMYLNGQRTRKDHQKALEWLKKAARKNHSQAKIILGKIDKGPGKTQKPLNNSKKASKKNKGAQIRK